MKSEVSGAKIFSVLFDGTTNVGELFGVVLRYIDAVGNCQQRLIDLSLYTKSFNAQTLGTALISALSSHSLDITQAVAFISDGASVNIAACDFLTSGVSQAVAVSCVSHGLCNVGEYVSWRVMYPSVPPITHSTLYPFEDDERHQGEDETCDKVLSEALWSCFSPRSTGGRQEFSWRLDKESG